MIPLYSKIVGALVVLVGLFVGGSAIHHKIDQGGFDRATSERAVRDAVATVSRVNENAVVATQQLNSNFLITKVKNEELTPVRNRINSDRVRVGPAICGSSTSTKAEDASSSDGGNSTSRLVSEQLEADIRALELRVEKALATGRSCQAFAKANGFWSDPVIE